MARVVGLDDIRRARTVIDGVVASTPVLSAGAISRWAGSRVVLKAENLQHTGAFKLRGAVNRMASLSDEERARGVVAASAGNHAQGVALAATALGVSSRVYMPIDAPLAKQVATADYGAEVVLVGETFEESFAAARADPDGRVLVPPFDDEARARSGWSCSSRYPTPTRSSCRWAAAGCCRGSRSPSRRGAPRCV
jgi:threonine dehydratase